MTPAKTPAERKADERQRQRDAGLVVVQVWVHPDDRAKLAHYIKRLNARYSRSSATASAKPLTGSAGGV
jgi:hypothetical protein